MNADPKLAGEKRLMNFTSLDEWRSEAYESAKIFKEKVKKWHDKRILKREFNVGDKVLLFRSRFIFSPGKLLSRWEGPFHIEESVRCYQDQQFRRHQTSSCEWKKTQTLYGR